MKLRVAEDLALPIEAVTETLGFLGRRGSGKTYAAQKCAEEMHKAGAQFVALDPVGKWWSLRLAADGVTPALPIPVFGGLHGDIPLEHTAGKLIADVVVDRGVSVVVDVSQFESDAQKARFVADFGNRFFFRKKASPSAVHVFIEEAQEFVPQNPQRDEAFMLHAWTRIQKLGRNFGIGTSLISQRPQEVNKKCLNLTEVLFVFQLTGSHERKAITEWIRDKDFDEDIYAELPKLATGHPHIWSPGWLQVSRVIRILEKSTFDASRTPEVGRRADVKELAPIDLEKLRRDMAATIERAKAEDPRELRRQVADLKSELAKTKTAGPVPVVTKIEVPVVGKGEISRLEKMVERLDAIRDRMVQAQQVVVSEVGFLREAIARVANPAIPDRTHQVDPPLHRVQGNIWTTVRDNGIRNAHRSRQTSGPAIPGGEDLTGPERRILEALAWLESIGMEDADQAAAAFLAGYTVGGGAWNNPRGRLHTRGLVEYRGGGRLALTEAGRKLAQAPEAPLTTEELQARVLERLPGPEQKLLRVLLEAYPKAVSNEDLAERAGYAVGGGAFANPRGRLRSLGLVEYQGKGMVVARSLLFLER